jgi:hypothetical protein
MDDFEIAEPEKYAAVMAMIALAEGKPIVHVDSDGDVLVCRRISGLQLEFGDLFCGECDWIDPPEARPDELTDEMAIGTDLLELGPGWWYDSYFRWFFVYEPALVVRSMVGDHSWVPEFLKSYFPVPRRRKK